MRAKTFIALALAAAYFGVASCRFACAMTMSGAPAAASVQAPGMEGCHHHHAPSKKRGDRRGQAPCCMSQSGDAPALVPGVVALNEVSTEVVAVVAAEAIEAPVLEQPFAESQGPPRAAQILESPSLSPRAPPFPSVVL